MNNYLLDVTWTDKWQVYLGAATLVVTFLTLIVTLFIAIKANRWAMSYWHEQKKEEINYQLLNLRYQGRLEAARAAWGLLAFLSEKESGNNFLVYRGTKEKPEVYFNIERGKKYISRLNQLFYEQGHGIFLTKEINNEIFHVRGNVYRVIDKEQRKESGKEEVQLENPHLIEFFRDRYEKLRGMIKTYVLDELKYEIEKYDIGDEGQ